MRPSFSIFHPGTERVKGAFIERVHSLFNMKNVPFSCCCPHFLLDFGSVYEIQVIDSSKTVQSPSLILTRYRPPCAARPFQKEVPSTLQRSAATHSKL